MTQQQIAYMNAITAREQLGVSREQAAASKLSAEAQMKQAQTAEQKRQDEADHYWSDNWFAAGASLAGIIALALL